MVTLSSIVFPSIRAHSVPQAGEGVKYISPLPWTSDDEFAIYAADNTYIVHVRYDPMIPRLAGHSGFDRARANAAFIVRCVNSHDDLVAALRDARVALEAVEFVYDPPYSFVKMLEAASAALAKAGAPEFKRDQVQPVSPLVKP
jgi:hypothetical protein